MESAELLEKVISGEKKVARATLERKKLIVKLFNFENLAKIWGKRAFLNIEDI